MRVLTADFETFWSQTHSLSKMSPWEYVMHDDTEIQSLSVKVNDAPTFVLFGEDDIRHFLRHEDFSDVMLVGHNMSAFDALVFSWRFGVNPRMWGCTLAMARPIYAKVTPLSLAALCSYLGLGVKDATALVQTKGRRLAEFTAEEKAAMEKYNADDADLCRRLFKHLAKFYNGKEMWHIDHTIRMLVEPQAELDVGLMEIALSKERSDKHRILLDMARMMNVPRVTEDGQVRSEDDIADDVRKAMASTPKFAALLESRGCPIPMKPSPTDKNKLVPALAKTDQEFLEMQDSPDEYVAAAARTRLSVKSTLLETRLEKFITAATHAGGKYPVPVKYCGADTTGRLSGWEYNPLNLPRIDPKSPKTSDALRRAIRAPKGHVIVVCDKSGIELRVNHTLWKVRSSMELYRQDPKADLYVAFAAARYGIKPEEVTTAMRQLAKVAQLGLGFGSGWRTFQKVAWVMSDGQMVLSDAEADDVVRAWRKTYADIVQGWRTCHAALDHIHAGREVAIDPWGLCHTCKDGIRLPSGRLIRYPMLHEEGTGEYWDNGVEKKEWWYGSGRFRARIYAGKVTENIVQALARDIICDDTLAVFKETGRRPFLQVYDELAYVVPEAEAEQMLGLLNEVMRTPPPYWKDLVLWSKGDIAERYGDAK